MSVTGLAWQPVRGSAPVAASSLQMLAGVGIVGDMHAHALSPRQLLLASASAYGALALPPHALRENLLLDIDTSCLSSGTVLEIGAEVRLRMMFQCEACGRLDAVQPRLAARIGAARGMLARVVTGGSILPGDPVRNLGVLWPAWSNDWRERVRLVLDAVPAEMVIDYRQLALLAGIQSSYCRAFPRVIQAFGPHYSEKAVPARAPIALERWQGDGLFTGS